MLTMIENAIVSPVGLFVMFLFLGGFGIRLLFFIANSVGRKSGERCRPITWRLLTIVWVISAILPTLIWLGQTYEVVQPLMIFSGLIAWAFTMLGSIIYLDPRQNRYRSS